MATNYTFAEAVKVIAEGTNMEAMQDIGKRFPLLMHYVSKLVATSGTDFVEFASKLPAFLTALKVNSALKADGADETEEKEEAPVEEAGAEKIAEDDKKTETPKKGRRGRPKKNAEPESVEDEKEEDDEYSGKTAKELFMLCKSRGIKTVPKKDSAFYAELLRKADAEEAKAKEAEDDDDWGDEEEPAEVEKKPAAKAKKEEPEDDDDDWDI